MCLPANKRYQHEQGKIKTKIKRMEKRKQKSIDDVREKIKRSSKKELDSFDKLINTKIEIENKLNEIIKRHSKKKTNKRK
jgi:hypothetical protein